VILNREESMGYTYKKHKNRNVLIEKPCVKVKGIKFLRRYLQFLSSGEKINFLYEWA
jgi:hypothetical protein